MPSKQMGPETRTWVQVVSWEVIRGSTVTESVRKGSGENQLRSVNGWIVPWETGVQCCWGGGLEGITQKTP